MTFMRASRDQRGYETTLLLHVARPGERARVLYWYRSAPGVRVGRRALDEDAIRAIEDQHPDIEFDWPQLLEEAESLPPEPERRPERPRRRAPRAPEGERPDTPAPKAQPAAPVMMSPRAVSDPAAAPPQTTTAPLAPASQVSEPVAPVRERNVLLDQLVGREIAARLRARYAEVAARLRELPEDARRSGWQQRADALDPDRWPSAEAILAGMQQADRLFDELKRELPAEN